MKPNKILIEALCAVADQLEQKEIGYNWHSPVNCNCGIVAHYLLSTREGWSDHQIIDKILDGPGIWAVRASAGYCTATGRPMTDILEVLAKYGFEQDDYEQLENLTGLGDEWGRRNRNRPEAVITYLRAKALQLEELRSKQATNKV